MRETLGTGTYSDRLERVLERVTDYEMLKKRITHIEDCRCWELKARCYVSKKRLFGRKCTKVHTQRDGIRFESIKKTFYFDPNQFLIWQMKG